MKQAGKLKVLAVVTLMAMGLSGCIGGGGSGSDAPETPVAQETEFKGQVIDGYIKGMICSADTDGDGLDDAFATEPTDELGNFTIPGLPTPSNVAVTCAPGPDGAQDMDNPGVPFEGVLSAPAGYTTVTPISTLIVALTANGKSLLEAEALAKSFLGLEASQELDSDFIANGDAATSTAAEAIHSLISNIDNSENYTELVDALAEVIIEKDNVGQLVNISDESLSESVMQKAEESNGDSNTGSQPTDTTAPVITLNGSSVVEVTQGNAYIDAMATATDNVDGDLTAQIIILGSVNTNTAGTYSITYNVTDAAGNAATQVARTIHVIAVDPGSNSELDASLLPPQVPSL